jgi:hypothetical protein
MPMISAFPNTGQGGSSSPAYLLDLLVLGSAMLVVTGGWVWSRQASRARE